MAGTAAPNRPWFRGRKSDAGQPSRPHRALVAAATRLDLGNRAEARRQRVLRQGWQLEAWAYRDSIGELRYAAGFLANCAARMRVYPAAYADGESDMPLPLNDPALGAPPELVAACDQAMKDLGNGKRALAQLLYSASTNLTVAGEMFLLGQEDPQTGAQKWSVRSIDEVIVYNDSYKLREVPMDPQGILGWVDLDPDYTVASRLWQPHPRFRVLADSPLRAIMDDCEALLILRRVIRATGRSRLAGRGLLLVPDELSLKVPQNDNDDAESDPFVQGLTNAMVEPISDEGVASAVVPLVVQGPGDTLDKVRLIDFASKFDEMSSKTREELVGIIATGLDIPKEVVTGIADLNHWSAWNVDDNTFRHHVEPHVVTLMDCFTSGYLRPYLQSSGLSQSTIDAWAERTLLWYDPTELVTHPDQASDAFQLHDRLAISDEALLRVTGFSEADAPSTDEREERLLRNQRTWPPNLVMEILHKNDPTLSVPPITQQGTIPGIKPGPTGGADIGEPPAAPAAPAAAPAAPPGTVAPEAPSSTQPGPPPATPPTTKTPPAVTAAGQSPKAELSKAERERYRRLSRRLVQIDQDLRTRLQTAANAALLRQLEKAGGRLRSKVAKDETMRSKILHARNEHVASVLGPKVTTALGLTAAGLVSSDWAGLKEQYYNWTQTAQQQALQTALQISGAQEADEAVKLAESTLAEGIDKGWAFMESSMNTLATNALHHPELSDPAAINPDTIVPMGTVRASVGIAGGASPQDFGLVKTNTGAEVAAIPLGQEVGQIGTGAAITDLLSSTDGAAQEGYTWIHGMSAQPFEPHDELDGIEFLTWDDPDLRNDGSFPDTNFYMPGDHYGCSCDWMPMWMPAETEQIAELREPLITPDQLAADTAQAWANYQQGVIDGQQAAALSALVDAESPAAQAVAQADTAEPISTAAAPPAMSDEDYEKLELQIEALMNAGYTDPEQVENMSQAEIDKIVENYSGTTGELAHQGDVLKDLDAVEGNAAKATAMAKEAEENAATVQKLQDKIDAFGLHLALTPNAADNADYVNTVINEAAKKKLWAVADHYEIDLIIDGNTDADIAKAVAHLQSAYDMKFDAELPATALTHKGEKPDLPVIEYLDPAELKAKAQTYGIDMTIDEDASQSTLKQVSLDMNEAIYLKMSDAADLAELDLPSVAGGLTDANLKQLEIELKGEFFAEYGTGMPDSFFTDPESVLNKLTADMKMAPAAEDIPGKKMSARLEPLIKAQQAGYADAAKALRVEADRLTSADYQAFSDTFDKVFGPSGPKAEYSAFVSHYTPAEMAEQHMVPVLSADGKTGALVRDLGDGRIEVTALFNIGKPGAGEDLLLQAIQTKGANYVEAMGKALADRYERIGFIDTSVSPFNPKLAPDFNIKKFGSAEYHTMSWVDPAQQAAAAMKAAGKVTHYTMTSQINGFARKMQDASTKAKEAIARWATHDYLQLAKVARGQIKGTAAQRSIIKQLDAAMQPSPLSVEVNRTVGKNGLKALGVDQYHLDDLVGKVVKDPGIVATSIKGVVGFKEPSLSYGSIMLQLTVPKGTPVALAWGNGGYEPEYELLLARDLRYVVTETGTSADGTFYMKGVVLP